MPRVNCSAGTLELNVFACDSDNNRPVGEMWRCVQLITGISSSPCCDNNGHWCSSASPLNTKAGYEIRLSVDGLLITHLLVHYPLT